jgi:hypothetical protein
MPELRLGPGKIAEVTQKETGIFRNEGRSKMGFVSEGKKTL